MAKKLAHAVKAKGPSRRRKEVVETSPAFVERELRGKQARIAAPLEDHAVFEPTALRADPVELLERQGPSRVAELLPIRYGRMVSSSFAFYRGAALVMAADLATTTNSGLRVQLCGDAHLSNFGGFATPERRVIETSYSISTNSTRPCPARSSGA